MLFANDEKNVIALACAISQNSLVQMIVPLALDEHHVYIYTHSENKQEEVCTKTTFKLIIASHTQRVYYCFVCRFFFTRMYGMYDVRVCTQCSLPSFSSSFWLYQCVHSAGKLCVYILIIIVASGAIRSKSLVMVCVILENRWEIYANRTDKWNAMRDLLFRW